MDYDLIVVGAGSSGAVVAARLAEDEGRRVLLLEAGPHFASPDALPEPLLAAHTAVLKGYNWPFQAHIREPERAGAVRRSGRVLSASTGASRLPMAKVAMRSALRGDPLMTRFDYPVGRVSGGSSAVNGTLALIGPPEDYDDWAARGNPSWAWDNIGRHFRELISRDGTVEYGRVPVQSCTAEALTTTQRAFVDACRTRGFDWCGDLGETAAGGVGVLPRNVHRQRRMSSALCFLHAGQERGNLTVRDRVNVNRVLLRNNSVIGVELSDGGRLESVTAPQVVLCAGAINTPAILMRSGIGDRAQLSELGIPVQLELPGVGRNLMDHPSVGLWCVPTPGACTAGEDVHQAMLRYTSEAGAHDNDMSLYMLSSVDTRQFPELQMVLGAPLGMSITVTLGKPESRGRIVLKDRSPESKPGVYLNCASVERDVTRLMEGVRTAWSLLQTSPLQDKVQRVFAWNQRIVDSDQLLRESIATFVRGSWHAGGTARMGPSADPMAVTDEQGGVHGCRGLFVADASIMPTLPRVPTNLSCMMIGERIADILSGKA